MVKKKTMVFIVILSSYYFTLAQLISKNFVSILDLITTTNLYNLMVLAFTGKQDLPKLSFFYVNEIECLILVNNPKP